MSSPSLPNVDQKTKKVPQTPPKPSGSIRPVPAPDAARAIRMARIGLVVNAGLTLIKLVAGILGNAYALVADAVESSVDMVGSIAVWSGLRIASRDPDDRYPFGYGRAEPLAAAAVAVLLLAAAVGIAITSISEIHTPHSAPAPYTLVVLVGVIVVKWLLYRTVLATSKATGSVAVEVDAWHHQSDAITSAAAFVGISIALIGGPGWEEADDWAALLASGVIGINGVLMMRSALRDLMDRAPSPELLAQVSRAALETPGVLAIEKLKVRRSGMGLYVDIHVQANPLLSLHDAHILSGCVKTSIRAEVPSAIGVLIHMEPFENMVKS
ncbi:MAG: cation diffusion facilitator family transporter [Gemmatimonadaceae bacterium]